MRMFFATAALLFIPLTLAFAHEGETEITNLAEAEWIGPLAALLIIVSAIIIAHAMRARGRARVEL